MAYCCRELKGGIRDVGFIPKDMQKRCLKVLNMHTNNSARYARIQVTGWRPVSILNGSARGCE
jgi:hypothetical protein